MEALKRLNIGSGVDVREGWDNLDRTRVHGANILQDLERPPYAWKQGDPMFVIPDNTYDEMLMSHTIEHLHNPLLVMQELHRIAKPGCVLVVSCPYGSSDDAFEDPTHYRQYFIMSWLYFSQLAYHKADYGYRGDWDLENLKLMIPFTKTRNMSHTDIIRAVYRDRNMVAEQVATLRCIKPIREPRPNAWVRPPLEIVQI